MNKLKAEKKIIRKATKALPCPFCGKTPKFNFRTDKEMSKHGGYGHYTSREGCCKATGSGQTELFFTNNYKKPNYGLWWRMFNSLVNDWNRRY